MKIIHLPYNPAGQMSSQAMALKKAGAKVAFCTYGANAFRYPTDLASPLLFRYGAPRKTSVERFMKECLDRYDLFHFHGALTFSNSYDYPDLPRLEGKKKVMNFWGSEVRRLSISLSKNPYTRVKFGDEAGIVDRLRKLSGAFEHVIVPDYEIYEYVKDFFQNIHIVRYVVEHEGINPVYPTQDTNRPLIVHAPSDPYLKGTEFVLEAVERLRKRFSFEFVLVQNMAHQEALQWYEKADIIVDQLCIGVYSILAIEGMLFGKPVITYIRDDLKNHYPPDLPLCSANPYMIEQELERLLVSPELRRQLGMQGRKYAIEHHAPSRIAAQLLQIYNQL